MFVTHFSNIFFLLSIGYLNYMVNSIIRMFIILLGSQIARMVPAADPEASWGR